jgi:dTDP-4-amino-4,6-dideoxygalactose transaminase
MKPQLHEEDIQAAIGVLRSGMLRAAGKCAELEQRFAKLSDARHGLTCSNGTTALQLAYTSPR